MPNPSICKIWRRIVQGLKDLALLHGVIVRLDMMDLNVSAKRQDLQSKPF